ncbi:MAG: hypothetical protein AABZ47_02340 [Planctomycetota bacterium]
MSHNSLCDLRSDAGAGELGTECGPKFVKVYHTSFIVLSPHSGLRPPSIALTDERWLAVCAQHDHATC